MNQNNRSFVEKKPAQSVDFFPVKIFEKKKRMSPIIANLTCLLSLFSSIESPEKWGLCEGGLCLCQQGYEPLCVTQEIIKTFCIEVSFFIVSLE
jgi:hypothetical protein